LVNFDSASPEPRSPITADEGGRVPVPAYFGFTSIAADMRGLIDAVDLAGTTGDGNIGRRYRRSVSEVQRQPFQLPYTESEPSLHFDLAEEGAARALDYLLSGEVPPRELQLAPETVAFTRERFEAGITLLEERCPNLLEPVRNLVGHVVFADYMRREGQTSLRNALGTVFWVSPFDNWRPYHFGDAIVHESTHQALFLKDMVRGLFRLDRQGLDDPAVHAISSIREIPRPYDLAFHAACVDAVLLSFFEACDDLPEMRRRTDAVLPALEDLDRKGEVLTPAGRGALDAAIRTTESAERLLAEHPEIGPSQNSPVRPIQ
jgi:hypothetical protein